jgi:hypothetical protein
MTNKIIKEVAAPVAIAAEGYTVTSYRIGFTKLDAISSKIDKALTSLETGLVAFAAFLLGDGGVNVLNYKTPEGRHFNENWNAHYDPQIDKAPEAKKNTIRSRKKSYKGRVLMHVALQAEKKGLLTTPELVAKKENLVATYGTKSTAKGTNEKRGIKKVLAEDTSSLFLRVSKDLLAGELDGMTEKSLNSIIMSLDMVLRAVGVDPVKLLASKTK